MLIDDFLPRYDAVERHRIVVRASPERCFAAVTETDFGPSGVLRALFAIRMLPATLLGGPAAWRALRGRSRRPLTLADLEASGFRRLATAPPREIVLGIEGRFWTLSGERRTPPASAFRDAAPAPGTARGVWNFAVVPGSDGVSVVTTETRVLCADARTRRRFLAYWALVRPGSGLIRRAMLRRIRSAAERRAH